MDRRMRALLVVLVAGLLVVLVAANAGAAGLGVGPPSMEIADAEQGQQYEDLIYVSYNNESDCTIELSASGDISNWVTFYDLDDLITPVEQTVAANKQWTYVRVKFDIPSDAPVGYATGTLHVRTVPLEGGEGGATLSLTGKVDVTIYIAGEGDGETPALTPTPGPTLTPVVTPTATATPTVVVTPTPTATAPPASEEEGSLNVWWIVGLVLGILVAGSAGYYVARRRG